MRKSSDRRPAVGFIFVTLVLIVLGFGIIIPVMPGLVTSFRGGSVSEGAYSYGWIVGVFALMQFVSAPILGALSDRYGRRKVLLVALGGSAVDYVIMGLAPSLGWLFVARMISGATAGALATCNAYIADVTPPEKRAQGFGLVGAAFGLGFAIGPAIGGILGSFGLRVPFFVAAGCVALNWLYGAFYLPESLAPANRRAFEWKRAHPIGAFGVLRRIRGVLDLAGMYFIFYFGQVMLQSIWVLYTGYRYGWSPLQVGLSLTLVGVVSAVVQGKLVRPIIGRLGEKRSLIAGLLITAAAFVGYGTATQGWMIYLVIPLGAFGGITGPSTQALITKHVPANEQGAVQGSLAGLTSLASIFAPLLSTWTFGLFVSDHRRLRLPGVPFFEASLLCLVALGLALASFRADAKAEAAGANRDPAI